MAESIAAPLAVFGLAASVLMFFAVRRLGGWERWVRRRGATMVATTEPELADGASQPETLPADDLDEEEAFEGFDAPASRRTKAARNWRVPSALDD